jgi:transposase
MSEPICPGCTERDAVIATLLARITTLETQVATLEARLGQNSSNSSIPPSANPPSAPPPVKKKSSGRKRGGQAGHKGHHRERLPADRVDHVIPLIPSRCERCQEPLPVQGGANDPEPTIHQVAELPRVLAVVTEFQGHARTCPCCAHVTREHIPEEITANAFGTRLTAALGYLAGCQYVSMRGLEEVADTLLGVPVSLGTINTMRQELADALEQPHKDIGEEVRSSQFKNADETSWKLSGQKCWLWVAVTAVAAFFLIRPKRDALALQALLGEEPQGVLGTDRYKAYSLVPKGRRQFCWAHLKRDFQAMVDRKNSGSKIGEELLFWVEALFGWWEKLSTEKITREQFRKHMDLVRFAVSLALKQGLGCGCAATEGTCAELLAHEESLWVFVDVPGVEPTNNAAERALRGAVLWRKRSFGSQSEAGCRFVERVLSVAQTLRMRGAAVLDFFADALSALRQGIPAPQILPSR